MQDPNKMKDECVADIAKVVMKLETDMGTLCGIDAVNAFIASTIARCYEKCTGPTDDEKIISVQHKIVKAAVDASIEEGIQIGALLNAVWRAASAICILSSKQIGDSLECSKCPRCKEMSGEDGSER